jgi:hypothetical protein
MRLNPILLFVETTILLDRFLGRRWVALEIG